MKRNSAGAGALCTGAHLSSDSSSLRQKGKTPVSRTYRSTPQDLQPSGAAQSQAPHHGCPAAHCIDPQYSHASRQLGMLRLEARLDRLACCLTRTPSASDWPSSPQHGPHHGPQRPPPPGGGAHAGGGARAGSGAHQMSEILPWYRLSISTSGAMYSGVPHRVLLRDSLCAGVRASWGLQGVLGSRAGLAVVTDRGVEDNQLAGTLVPYFTARAAAC